MDNPSFSDIAGGTSRLFNDITSARSSFNNAQTSNTPGTVFNHSNDPKFFPAAEKNILHNYRTWSYNWTLGAITPEAVTDPTLIERDLKLYTVLNTAGKGNKGMSVSQQGLNQNSDTYKDNQQLVDEFNKVSPGRFDMYLDNIGVESVIGAGSKAGGAAISTNITFDVIEPYSMNGFIEALQVACRAAGYNDYMKGSYALRVHFQGWPDGTNIDAPPEIIPNTTRIFPIKITELNLDVDIDGSKYKIGAVPLPQMGFGVPNLLKSDVKLTGNTVGDVLLNFSNALNKMASDQAEGAIGDSTQRDVYEISCPKMVTVDQPQSTLRAVIGNTSTAYMSTIVNSKMNDVLQSTNVMSFGNISTVENGYVGAKVAGSDAAKTADPSTGKITPTTGTLAFSQGSRIHDCIATIIRDSEYTRNLLTPENLEKVKQGDGLVNYFTIRLEVEILGEDATNNKEFSKFRYVVEPYKIHYTRIPGQEQGDTDLTKVKQYIKRDYDYLYSGKNVDITKFSLNFNNLYFTAIPAMMGNRYSADSKSKQAGPNNQVEVKQTTSTSVTPSSKNVSPKPSRNTDVALNDNASNGGKAGQVQETPYAKMAQALHEAVLNGVELINGNLSILGDPYYLVTGGMINADLKLKEPFVADDGQAPTTQGDIYINITFKNPIDFDSSTGLVTFGENPLSYSGVYRLLTLVNNFRDGLFTQELNIVRIPGQIIGKGTQTTSTNMTTSPLSGQQLVSDSALPSVLRAGIRPSDFNISSLLSRGVPSIGLPSQASNFTNVSGFQSGSLLNQTVGAQGMSSVLNDSLSASPISGANPLTNGVRLSAADLANVLDNTKQSSAAMIAAGNLVNNYNNIPNASSTLASDTAVNYSQQVSQLQVDQASQESAQLVTQLASKSNSFINGKIGNVSGSISTLQASSADTVAAQMGINSSLLAGLSPDLLSQLSSELTNLSSTIPVNTDLGVLDDQGLLFGNLSADQLGNLPATQPQVTAPMPLSDRAAVDESSSIMGLSNPYGQSQVGVSFGTSIATDGMVAASNSLVNKTIAANYGVTDQVGLFQNATANTMPAYVGLGSVESNNAVVSGVTNIPTSNTLGITLNEQFGSLQNSPLSKLISNNNNNGSV